MALAAAGLAAGALAPGVIAPEPDDNLLKNPSFEDDSAWWSFHERSPEIWGDFTLTDALARTGRRSARLDLEARETDGPVRVYGVVQEVSPGRCPEYISGWYRVEGWSRGTRKQYLQIVAIVWNPTAFPEGLRAGNYQVACTLAGVEEAPLARVANRRFIVTGPAEPDTGEWVFFELELARAFEQQWGIRPEGFESLRIFFEVRYDDRGPEERPRATVFYDDVYLGDRSREE